MKTLDGKTAIVTGSGRGIGRAIALKLASEGARVVVNDLDPEPGFAVVKEIADAGGEAIAVNGSVTDADFGDRLIAECQTAFGVPDIIVNNAGFTWDSVIQRMSDEQFDAVMDVHLKAPFRILRAVQPVWKAAAAAEAAEGQERIRKVVNISSIAGVSGNLGQVNYSAGKAAIVGLTKTLSKEWGRMKVTVNAVAFGLIGTRMTQATDEKQTATIDGRELPIGIPSSTVEAFESQIPLGRQGTPEEAAGAVYLLTIPESDYVSGEVIVAGGGFRG